MNWVKEMGKPLVPAVPTLFGHLGHPSGTVFTHAETAIQQVGFLAKNKAIKLKNIAYVSG